MLRRRAFALSLLLLAGCGGSSHRSTSGSSNEETVGPQITLAWPARLRVFGAPQAATAAYVTFPAAGVNGNDVSQLVIRPEGAAAVTKSYQLGVAVHPGRHLVRVDFIADATGGGALATAALNVEVTRTGELRTLDGKTLPSIAYDSAVTGLVITPNQTLAVGASADLAVSASTTSGLVALKPGSVSFAVTSGAGILQVNADGTVTGLAAGNATVTANVGGVTSPGATVVVSAASAEARSLAVETNDLVFDRTRNIVWVASGNGVARFDPESATLGTSIALTASPTALALSNDGSSLYAGLQSLGTVRRIDLATNTVGASFALPDADFGGQSYAQQIAVQPGGETTLAIVRRGSSGGYDGPEIYDSGVRRPNGLSLFSLSRTLWLGANRLLAYPADRGGIADVAVDAQGATITRTVATQADLTHPLVLSGGRLYASNGIAIDSTTLESIGAFPLPSGFSLPTLSGPAIDGPRKRAYFVEFNYGSDSNRLHVYDTETFNEISNRRISGLNVSSPPFNGFDANLTLVGDRLVFRLSDQVVVLDGVSAL